MKLSMTKAAVGLKEYIILGLGMFLYAFGWTACIIPSGGMGGGATGMSMLLNAVFPAINPGSYVPGHQNQGSDDGSSFHHKPVQNARPIGPYHVRLRQHCLNHAKLALRYP